MDYKVVIDAGHGGNDPGAVGSGLLEKDYTLLISKYIKNRLDKLGIESVLVRDTDETVSPTERVNRILNAFGNNRNVIVLSNHLNAGGGEGSEVVYALRNNNTLANKILNNLGEEGLKMRKTYQRTLPNDKTKDYYFIHRNTGITEPVLIEYGFIDNINDSKKIMNNYEKYAEGVVKAVSDYIGVNYIPMEELDTYIVKKGDTLWNIAKKNNLTVEELKKYNNLNNNLLYIGQELKLPIKEENIIEEGNIYEVKKGDTLYSIAKNNNTTVDKLKEVNSLVSDILTIGTNLLIPVSDIIIHKVILGDSLWALSKKYNTTVDMIKELNNLVSDIIKPGDELKIKRNTK